MRALSSRPRSIALVAALAATVLCGCPKPLPEVKSANYASPDAGKTWTPPEAFLPAKPEGDAGIAAPAPAEHAGPYSLTELVDAALMNNPQTRLAWAQALASAANWGRARSDYYPWLDGSGAVVAGKIPQLQGGKSYGQIGASLSYLLLDFGARGAKAEAARQALAAADWNHNQAISDLLRDVPRAYATLVAQKAQLRASEQALVEARESLAATRMRKDSGVATVADVLQAQSAEAQARLNLAAARGNVEIARGSLATVVGWPANTRFDVEGSQREVPTDALGRNVDALVTLARESRADLNAAWATLKQREAELKAARAVPFPTLIGSGTLQRQVARGGDSTSSYGGVQLSIPIFHGFDMRNQVHAARANVTAAEASLKLQEEGVVTDVWNSFQDFRTAKEQLVASRALLASASESFQASLARYKAGAAQIVELLNAQTTLAGARSQLIGSKANLTIAYANLVRAVGSEIPAEQREPEADAASAPMQGTGSGVEEVLEKHEP